MAQTQFLARPLLASMFISGGIDSIRDSDGKVAAAEAVTKPLTTWFPALPSDTATLVRLNGAVQVGAGALLTLGKCRRLATTALIGSLVATTYAGHRFWEESDPQRRSQQRVQFLKNCGMLGGLVLELAAPSRRRRERRAATRRSVASAS